MSRVGAEAIARGCFYLRVLDLAGCGSVRDDCLAVIGGMKCLKSVNLSRCARVTDGGIERFCAAKPVSIRGTNGDKGDGI